MFSNALKLPTIYIFYSLCIYNTYNLYYIVVPYRQKRKILEVYAIVLRWCNLSKWCRTSSRESIFCLLAFTFIINRITFLYSVHSCNVLFIGSDLHLTNKEPKWYCFWLVPLLLMESRPWKWIDTSALHFGDTSADAVPDAMLKM